MTELLFCNEPIAAVPYYIEGISWNVYSLEELCYYIEHNTYLLEKSFMTEELCSWIGTELQNTKLAEQLLTVLQQGGKLSEFVLVLLSDCAYCSYEKIKEIIEIICHMEEKSDFECRKIRADRLMEKEKYLSSIYEYKSLLELDEAREQGKELLGSIWHNLGTAYARMFLFGEAANCYEKAYRCSRNTESLKECFLAYDCLENQAAVEQIKEKYDVSEETWNSICAETASIYSSEAEQEIEAKISALSKWKEDKDKTAYQKALSQMIFEWKEEYRRICRI